MLHMILSKLGTPISTGFNHNCQLQLHKRLITFTVLQNNLLQLHHFKSQLHFNYATSTNKLQCYIKGQLQSIDHRLSITPIFNKTSLHMPLFLTFRQVLGEFMHPCCQHLAQLQSHSLIKLNYIYSVLKPITN